MQKYRRYKIAILQAHTMKLYIKYMVSLRCKMLVKDELSKLGISLLNIDLGKVEIKEDISETQFALLKKNLLPSGLELLDDKQSILIEKIRNVVAEMIYYSDELPRINYSEYLSEKLEHDYSYLSNIFSEMKGITLQHFIILQKIDRVKELLIYDKLSLTEISYLLNYSSVAHLSQQFKKITGITPSFFKAIAQNRQKKSVNNVT